MPGELRTLLHVERVLLLKKTPPLDTLASPLLGVVAEYARERLFPKGSVLLREGEPVNAIYFVADGKLRVRARGQEFAFVRGGAGVGGLGLLSRSSEGVHVVAETDVLVLELRAEVVREMLEENFGIFHHILRGLSRELVEFRWKMPEISAAAAPPLGPVHTADRDLDLVERIFFLRQVPPFTRCSINALADLARGLNQMRFDAGVRLFSEGDPARAVFLVLSGEIDCPSPSRGQMGTAGPGSPLGALETIAEVPRWHDAVTRTSVSVLTGDNERLLDAFEDNFGMGLDYLAMVAGWVLRIFDHLPDEAIRQQYFGCERLP